MTTQVACAPQPRDDEPDGPIVLMPRREFAPADSVRATEAFARLKTLAGSWSGRSVGYPASALIELTANGSAILERIVVEDPVEMATVYSMDGPRLIAMHHCAAGNQPLFYLDERTSSEALFFTFDGGTNFHSPADPHMHSLEIRLVGDTAVTWDWHLFRQAQFVEINAIHLRRRQ